MNSTKEHVLRIINDKIRGVCDSPIIALQGSPGVGKTKLAKAIATALDLPFHKISLGGNIDVTMFKGSETVWVGSNPSLLVQFLARSGTSDIVILLDEVDKLGDTHAGLQIQHALLHILDPIQNKEFQDVYLNEIPHDLSRIWFVLSMNDETRLDKTLLDRLNIVRVNDYSPSEKAEIVMNYTMPHILKDKGFLPGELILSQEACDLCVAYSGKDGGIRKIEHILNEVVSKINLYASVSGDVRKNMTYRIPKFNGFPYVVTDETMKAVVKIERHELSYYS